MREYYVLTVNPILAEVLNFIHRHQLEFELHLNRTRFWVPDGPVLTEFLLRFSQATDTVDPTLDKSTGLPLVGIIEHRP